MKKKLLIAFLTVFAVGACAFGLTACSEDTEEGGKPEQGGSTEHKHSYLAEVVEPACEERGYTVYTCSCDDSYIDANTYTNAVGHNYEDNICTRCGEIASDMSDTEDLEYSEIKDKDGVVLGYAVSGLGTATTKAIKIPSVYNNKPVTAIGNYAFWLKDITSVLIPDSVTSIGDWAFAGCVSLKNIIVGNGVTSIGERAFFNCTGLTEVTLGNSVASIGNEAFSNCGSLASLTLPDSVTSIGENAFLLCNGLVSLTFGNGVTAIGEGAFSNCSRLISIVIPDSVTSIGKEAFSNCSRLSKITVSDNVTSIGEGAFSGTAYYNNTDWEDSVLYIGKILIGVKEDASSCSVKQGTVLIADHALYNCSSLKDINFSGTVEQWNAVKKGSSWNGSTGNYTIHCTDGDIAK